MLFSDYCGAPSDASKTVPEQTSILDCILSIEAVKGNGRKRILTDLQWMQIAAQNGKYNCSEYISKIYVLCPISVTLPFNTNSRCSWGARGPIVFLWHLS